MDAPDKGSDTKSNPTIGILKEFFAEMEERLRELEKKVEILEGAPVLVATREGGAPIYCPRIVDTVTIPSCYMATDRLGEICVTTLCLKNERVDCAANIRNPFVRTLDVTYKKIYEGEEKYLIENRFGRGLMDVIKNCPKVERVVIRGVEDCRELVVMFYEFDHIQFVGHSPSGHWADAEKRLKNVTQILE